MTIRYDDLNKTLTLSVRDVIEGQPRGDLRLELVQRATSRMAMGRDAHTAWQAERGAEDHRFRAEVRLQQQLVVSGWTVKLHGRVDGLVDEGGRRVVEELKSTALDASRLYGSELSDWPDYVAQLELYLWMLRAAGDEDPIGRLVLVSLVDGARHVMGVRLEAKRVEGFIRSRLEDLIRARERRLAWLGRRREQTVPVPFVEWREGQEEIARQVEQSLDAGRQLLIQAPTGLGKTAAVMYGVLRYALRTDKQVFWATARTTHQRVAEATLRQFEERGLGLRSVTISAKDKICLNEVVSCRPDTCPFAQRYFDKLRDNDVVHGLCEQGQIDRALLHAAGSGHEVCPYELALDVSEQVDVVIGDYNYAFDPSVTLKRHFGDAAGDWIVVVDECHQLVERARGYGSPSLSAQAAAEAAAAMAAADEDVFAPFIFLARQIEDAICEVAHQCTGAGKNGWQVAELSPRVWSDLSDRVDEVGLDYALLKAQSQWLDPGQPDPWLDLARAILRFHGALEQAGEETVPLFYGQQGREVVRLYCLDPSRWLKPRWQSVGGFVGMSATLSPTEFYRDLLGLDGGRLDQLSVVAPFPPENRHVVVAPRVSTAWRDRAAHADATARLIADCIRATPGNVAVYFPSFAMQRDIAERWDLDREVMLQPQGLSEDDRDHWLRRLGETDVPLVLAAVLGGIFAEGVDLPSGALSSVIVAGPALPPVGLERDLLRAHYEERFGAGFLYASLVPGMTRVVQAAGRLIRRPEDRGVVVLVGRRFRWRDVAALLPSDWEPVAPSVPSEEVAAFFGERS